MNKNLFDQHLCTAYFDIYPTHKDVNFANLCITGKLDWTDLERKNAILIVFDFCRLNFTCTSCHGVQSLKSVSVGLFYCRDVLFPAVCKLISCWIVQDNQCSLAAAREHL